MGCVAFGARFDRHGRGAVWMEVINLRGSPWERGQQHGKALSMAIRKSLSNYRQVFEAKGLAWNKAQELALKYIPYLEKGASDLLEEMEGICSAIDCRFAEIVALNVRSEILNWGTDGCTSLGVSYPATYKGNTMIGQNWDQQPRLGHLAVLRVHQSPKPTVLLAVEPGMVGKFGLNSAGIGLGANLLFWPRSDLGFPVRALERKVLDCGKLEQAIDLTRNAQVSFAFAFSMGSADEDGLMGVELTPKGPFLIPPEKGILVHTNHFLTEPGVHDASREKLPDTLYRFQRAKELLAERFGTIGVREIMSILKDHRHYPRSICRHLEADKEPPVEWSTLVSLVLDLRSRTMYLAQGHPCRNSYAKIDVLDETASA